MPAFRGLFAEALLKVKEFPEGGPSHDIHDAGVVFLSGGRPKDVPWKKEIP